MSSLLDDQNMGDDSPASQRRLNCNGELVIMDLAGNVPRAVKASGTVGEFLAELQAHQENCPPLALETLENPDDPTDSRIRRYGHEIRLGDLPRTEHRVVVADVVVSSLWEK
eukprot:GEMP01073957.1.p2 GENE.GEMP01073957.1~~GEMP01073957.1.p2  ORF type:complete len:112 (-),score=28.42 GEMP01073957.1:608-943(-)